MKNVLERFLHYVKFDTSSDDKSTTYPSTKKQLDLANHLVEELKNLKLENIELNHYGYVTATLPANTDTKSPTLAFIAHMDTSPAVSGANVKPQIIKNYSGGEILLNKEKNIVLSSQQFPQLNNYIGQDLITTDGTTLLGADDKAGIAEIITALEYLIKNPDIKHGTIKVAFTPDEEIGRGVDYFDIEKFGADYAYTVDGGEIGELNYETFNAAQARIIIKGISCHTGTAKNNMINSMHLGMEFNSMLPINEKPEYTEGYEGFFHLEEFQGTVEKTELRYLIRDHNKLKFDKRKKQMKKIVDFLNNKYGLPIINLEIKDQYYNLKEKIEEEFHLVTNAKKAMESLGIPTLITPIRGGTDGAILSYKGLPCPNLFTGGHNFHSLYEYIPVQSMEKAVQVIVKIVQLYCKE